MKRTGTAITIAAALLASISSYATAAVVANGAFTIVPVIGGGSVTVDTGNITLATASKHEPPLVVQDSTPNLFPTISPGAAVTLSSSTLAVPAGIGATVPVNFTMTINGIEFTFTSATTDARVALDVPTNTAGSFAEQFSGTLTNGNGIFVTGTPTTLSEACTQSVQGGHAGLISCANSVVTIGQVPEPASLGILGAALLGFGIIRRRRSA